MCYPGRAVVSFRTCRIGEVVLAAETSLHCAEVRLVNVVIVKKKDPSGMPKFETVMFPSCNCPVCSEGRAMLKKLMKEKGIGPELSDAMNEWVETKECERGE